MFLSWKQIQLVYLKHSKQKRWLDSWMGALEIGSKVLQNPEILCCRILCLVVLRFFWLSLDISDMEFDMRVLLSACYTLPESNSSPLKICHPKRKQSYYNLHFSAAIDVSFREGKGFRIPKKTIKDNFIIRICFGYGPLPVTVANEGL